MTGILFWAAALSSSMSKSVNPFCASTGARTVVRASVKCQCWIIQTHCPFLVYNFPWWIPTGREGDNPPIENVTSARPSKSPGGPLSPTGSRIDRPAVSDLSCCRVVGGVVGRTHDPRRGPRKPKIPGSRTQQLDPSLLQQRAVFSFRLASQSRHRPGWIQPVRHPPEGCAVGVVCCRACC